MKGETLESVRAPGLWRHVYLRWLYRPLMQLAHRHAWHHAPKTVLEDGSILECCDWCGLRCITAPTKAQSIVAALNAAKDNE